jgi:cholinesterase
MSIAVHLVAYGGRNDGLFRGAILESGSPPTQQWDTATSNASNAIFESVVTTLGCAGASDKLTCLRAVPYDTIYAAFNPANNGSEPTLFPVIDGTLIPENPVKAIVAGQYLQVPTIIGTNDDEGSLFAVFPPNELPNTDAEVNAYLAGTCNLNANKCRIHGSRLQTSSR